MEDAQHVLDEDFSGLSQPKLYGKTPVIWYSFLFTPIVGGALMAINLFRLDKKAAAFLVLLSALLFTIGLLYFTYNLSYQASARLLVLLSNLAAGNVLGTSIWKNQIGQISYKKANPWYPLLFVIAAYVLVGTIFLALVMLKMGSLAD